MATVDARSASARSGWRYDVPFGSWFGLVRHITAGGVAGMVAGLLVGGLGSRVFMRIAGAASGALGAGRLTEAGNTVGEVTLTGTYFLVVFIGIASGLFGAGMYLATRPWLGWAGKWRGVVFGIVLFALTSATSDMMNPDNPDFATLGNGLLLVALIVVLFVAFGVVTDQVFRWLDSRLRAEGEGRAFVGVAYAVFAALGALVVVPVVVAILRGGQGTCGCETPVWASWSFVLVGVSTVVIWVDAISRLPSWATRIATTTGYLGVSGVVVFGLLRALSDATDIIR